jgi:diguanylate cyclase (GGDEF)-like protein
METLITATQSRYEDGARALVHLIRAERFVDDTRIAEYISDNYKSHYCDTDARLEKSDEVSSALCLTYDHSYYAMLSPLISEGRVIGYDRLVFDLTDQIRMLCTSEIHSALFYQDAFEVFIQNADVVESSDAFTLFYKEGVYYLAFNMQDGVHFVSSQNADSLLEPVHRLSKQILYVAIGIVLAFTIAIYFFIIRFAINKLVHLENSRRSLAQAVKEANLDPLTEVGGRRFGEKFLSKAFERFQEGEASPAIVVFDIDSLKQINDTYGHSVGDRVIRSVAKAVQQNIRSEDALLRWGGDEFIGIFTGLAPDNAMSFAPKLLKAVSNLSVSTDTGVIHPTISLGVSYFQKEDRSFLEALNRADRAMYQSKAEGKNRAHER